MKMSPWIGMVVALGVIVLSGCGRKSAEEKAAEEAAEAARQAAQAAPGMGGAMGQAAAQQYAEAVKNMEEAAQAAGAVETVDFRKLKELLPEKAGAAQRSSIAGEKSGMGGFQVSRAEAEYTVGEGNVNATITDLGGTGTPAAMMMAAWTMAQIDRETDAGYEKTSVIKGHKAHEQYDTVGRYGSLEVLVVGRFLVELKGNQVSMDDIKGVLDHMDLGKIASMK